MSINENRDVDTGFTAKGERRQFVQHSYTDYASEEDGPLSKKDEAILAQYDENRVGGPFPLKLHIILKILEKEGNDDVFSWLPHGRSFGIHKPGQFEDVIKRFFRQSQISSFRRQLNLYGFLRLTNGRDSGSYYHELFLRGKPLLSLRMTRTRIKGTKIRASSSPADEPRLYSYPVLGPAERPERLSMQRRDHHLMPAIAGPGMISAPRDEREMFVAAGGLRGEASQFLAPRAGGPSRSSSEMAYLNQMRAAGRMQPEMVQIPSNADPMLAQVLANRNLGAWGSQQNALSQSFAQSKANYFNAIQSMGSGAAFPRDGIADASIPMMSMPTSAGIGAISQNMAAIPAGTGIDMISQNMAQQRYVEELERTVAIQNMERQGLMNSIAASSMARLQGTYAAPNFPVNGMVVANQLPAFASMMRAAAPPVPSQSAGATMVETYPQQPEAKNVRSSPNAENNNASEGSESSNGRDDKEIAAAMVSMGSAEGTTETKDASNSSNSSKNLKGGKDVVKEEDGKVLVSAI